MQRVTIGDRELERFCTGVASLWNIDVSAYGKRQLNRRLASMMRKNGVTRLDQLLKKMKRDPDLADRLRIQFTINVSEFFRDIHLFDALEKFLRKAMRSRRIRTVWSAGCSYGAEAYSLAIILDELGARGCSIVASDIDDRALEQARRGVFKESDLEHVSHVRRRRYFEEIRPEEYRIDARLRRWVQFKKIDLLNPRGRQPTGCDLILCRNVIIYFQPEVKEQVHELLSRCLRDNGLLFVGATERVNHSGDLGLRSISPFIYEKDAA